MSLAQVVVVGHTRELAFQISKEYARFGKFMPQVRSAPMISDLCTRSSLASVTHFGLSFAPQVRVGVFYGGVPVQENIATLKGDQKPQVVVGTPGRLVDLIEKKVRTTQLALRE